MRLINQRKLGYILIGFAVLLGIVLIFVKTNVDKQEAFLCDTIHSNPSLNLGQCPAHNSPNSWLILVAFGVAFIILVSGSYMVLLPVRKEEDFKKIDISKLDEEEKDVYDLLKKNEGSLYQSDLIKETEFSKVRITRILDKMASKGIIERKRRGMTNIVILK